MSETKPLISVIMSTYNPNKEYLRQSVQSILCQTYSNIELIIINDGSEYPITPLLNGVLDPRVNIVEHKDNRKLPTCLNEAISISKGEFVARMDDDDIAYPQRLEKQLQIFLKDKKVQVLGSSIELFGDKVGIKKPNLSQKREEQQADFLLENASIPHPTCMFRKEFLYKNNLRYNEEFRDGAEDYALWIMISRTTKIDYIEEPLLKYRKHGKQVTKTNIEKQHKMADQARWEQLKSIDICPTEEEKNIHRKLSHIICFEKSELKKADHWLKLIKKQNRKYKYFQRNALKKKLNQRAATLYLKYFNQTKDYTAVFYIIKYLTIQNLKNWWTRSK